MVFNFQLLSDLHLEMPRRGTPSIFDLEPTAPYLVLAGDIGYPREKVYQRFLFAMAKKFQKVFVVAGNHEFYHSEYYKELENMANICKTRDNLIFLHKGSYLLEQQDAEGNIEKLRVLGTTLWSDIPPNDRPVIAFSLNDYNLITINNGGWCVPLTIDNTLAMFRDEKTWLENQIQASKEQNEKVLVITHHAPKIKGTSAPDYECSPLTSAFASNLNELWGPPIHTWFFGHTHYCSDQTINGMRLVSNQMGYVHENLQNFDPKKVFSV